MKIKIKKLALKRPKVSFNQFSQLTFTLREVLKLILRVKPKLLIAVLTLNGLLGLSNLLVFYIQKLILDRLVAAIGAPDISKYLVPILFLLVAAYTVSLFNQIANSITSFMQTNLARYFDLEVDILLGAKISSLDMATIDDPDFKNRLDKIERESGKRAWQLMMPISNLPQFLVGFVSAVGVTYLIHPLVPLAIVLVSLPRLFVNRKYVKLRYQLDSELSTKNRIWNWLRMYLVRSRNFLEMKILDLSGYLLGRLREVGGDFVGKKVKIATDQEKAGFWTVLPVTISEFLVAGLLAYWVIIRKITIGSFQFYISSLRSAEGNLTGMVNSFISIYENYMYVTDLVWILGLEPQIKNEGKGNSVVPTSKLSITFDNVWFRYRDDLSWVLNGNSFEINPGEKIAIVGENGAGKTTLIKILSRFYDPNKGDVLVSGQNLKEFDPRFWRERVGILFQDFESFPFTARESIGYGDVNKLDDLEKIKKVAKVVGIDDYISSLPLGYDTPLSPDFEKGIRPSVGQWQRIGIARILFRDKASLIILDEPTSNVDPEAEERIFKQLRSLTKDKILIFVTQRFSTVRIADRIFVMDKGRIIEQGTHKELMKENGKYARLFNLQAQAYTQKI